MDDAQRLIDQGYAARKEGNSLLALDLYQQAAERLRQLNPPLRLAHTIRHVADIQSKLLLLESAQANYAEALAIYRAAPDAGKLDIANTLRGYALLSELIGDTGSARKMWVEARELYAAAEVQAGVEEADQRLNILTERLRSF